MSETTAQQGQQQGNNVDEATSTRNRVKEEQVRKLEKEVKGEDPTKKVDWLKERMLNPDISTHDLSNYYGVDAFDQLKSSDDYWDDEGIRDKFSEAFGVNARIEFNKFYDNTKKEYSLFKLDVHQNSKTASEVFLSTKDRYRTDISERFQNMWGTLQTGDEWSDPRWDERENFKFVRDVKLDADGNPVMTYYDYSPSLLDNIMSMGSDGLVYGDIWKSQDPRAGVYGVFFDISRDGQVWSDSEQEFVDVRNDQVVSRHDLDTGSAFDGLLKNNGLEADGILDYTKAIVRAPVNLFADTLDTVVQMMRVGTVLSYSAANLFRKDKDKLDVVDSEFYKVMSGIGITLKGLKTSSSREAMTDGVFGSFEAQLDAVFSVAGQIFLARGLGSIGSGAAKLMKGNLTGNALIKAQQAWANKVVRTTLTSLAAKDSYNEALDNGFSERDAALITAATVAALWQATRFAGYITGEFDVKQARAGIKQLIVEEQPGFISKAFTKIVEQAEKASSVAIQKGVNSAKGKVAFSWMSEKMGKLFKVLYTNASKPGASRLMYEMQQEALEEMSEEIGQELVKQGASAYGAIVQGAKEAGKGRFMSIFDEGFFPDLAKRVASSGLLGGLGGGMGMIGSKHNITPISSIVDIVLQGRQEELFSVLREMKAKGELGPIDLSTQYNEEISTFEPIIQGQDMESLGDMIYKMYELDVEDVETFMKHGLGGVAMLKLQSDDFYKEDISGIAMRKDYIRNSTELFALFKRTGLDVGILTQFDNLTEQELQLEIPKIVKSVSNQIEEKTTEIEKLKKQVNTKAVAVDEESTGKKGKKGKLKKEVVEKRYPKDEDSKKERLNILERQLESLKTVTDEDVANMFDLYSKIRSVANGTASEHYLLQKELLDDEAFGGMGSRADKYKHLGDQPFIDLMHKSVFRSLDDEKVHLRKAKKVKQNTSKILAIKEIETDEDIMHIDRMFAKNKGLISKESLEHVLKLIENSDLFKDFKTKVDPKHKGSIFKEFTGVDSAGKKLDTDHMKDLYLELIMNDAEGNREFLGDGLYTKLKSMYPVSMADIKALEESGEFASDFDFINENIEISIESFFSGIDNIVLQDIPQLDANGELGTTSNDINSPNVKLLAALTRSNNPVAKSILDSISSKDLALSRMSREIATALDPKIRQYFDPNSFTRGDISVIMRTESKGKFTKETIFDEGISEVLDLINNTIGNIITKKDHKQIDDIILQIDLRDKMADVFRKFYGPGIQDYGKMLSSFRKNVLGIIDREYDEDEVPDTLEEVHAYKDKTALSDFFVDFIYDPVRMQKALLAEEEGVTTDNDDAIVEKLSKVKRTLDAIVEVDDGKGNDVEIQVKIDEELLKVDMFDRFGSFEDMKDLRDMIEMLESGEDIDVKSTTVGLTGEVGLVKLRVEGITKLKLLNILLEKAKAIIIEANGGTSTETTVPYVKNKNEAIVVEFRTYNSLLGVSGLGRLVDFIENEHTDFDKIRESEYNGRHVFVDTARMNIKIEKILYRVFHEDIPELENEDGTQEDIKNIIIEYIKSKGSASSDGTKAVRQIDVLNFLLGAITTDFTDYYAASKARLESIGEDSKEFALLALQERAAKYSSAYIYSKELRDAFKDGEFFTGTTINAIFVRGAAGTGKSTAVADIGIGLGIDVLNKRFEGTALEVAPVSNHSTQVKIITDSVGKMAGGQPGRTVEELYDLLEKAAVENDKEAIKTLQKIGAIVMDEVTYVNFANNSKTDGTITLENINELIATYNSKHRGTNQELAWIVMGDTDQSGAASGSSLGWANAFPIDYMNFSMRARNSYLTAAIETLTKKYDPMTAAEAGYSLIVEKKTKYGLLDGKFYGMRLDSKPDDTDSSALLKHLSDDELLTNMEENLKKDSTFNIIISPDSLIDFNDSLDGLPRVKAMIKKYPDRVSIIDNASIGGSEANYVIAEIPAAKRVEGAAQESYDKMRKNLNTVVTRAKDFGLIITKDDAIIIPVDNESDRIDGEVRRPDVSVDSKDKKAYIKHNLDILADIEADDSGKQAEPEVEPETEEEKEAREKKEEEEKEKAEKNKKKTKEEKRKAKEEADAEKKRKEAEKKAKEKADKEEAAKKAAEEVDRSIARAFNDRVKELSAEGAAFSPSNIISTLNSITKEAGISDEDSKNVINFFTAVVELMKDYSDRDAYENFIEASSVFSNTSYNMDSVVKEEIAKITALVEELYVAENFARKKMPSKSLADFSTGVISRAEGYLMTKEEANNKEAAETKRKKLELDDSLRSSFKKYYEGDSKDPAVAKKIEELAYIIKMLDGGFLLLSEDEETAFYDIFSTLVNELNTFDTTKNYAVTVDFKYFMDVFRPLFVNIDFPATKLPAIDPTDNMISDFNLLINKGKTLAEIDAVIAELEKMAKGDADTLTVGGELVDHFNDLINRYEFNSVVNALLNLAKEAKNTLRAKTSIDKKKERLDAFLLYLDIGSDNYTEVRKSLYSILNSKDNYVGTNEEMEKRRKYAAVALKLVNELFPAKKKGKKGKGAHLYNRSDNTLDSYIIDIEKGVRKGQVYTADVNPRYFSTDFKSYMATNKIEVADAATLKKIKDTMGATSYQVVAIKGKYKSAYLVATFGGKKYIVSAFIFSKATGTVLELSKQIDRVFKKGDGVETVGDNQIFITSKLDKDGIIMRASRINLANGSKKGKSIKELKEAGVIFSKKPYQVNTDASDRGAYFYLYTYSPNVDLESKEVKDAIKKENVLSNNKQITFVLNGVEVTIGLMPFKVDVKAKDIMAVYNDLGATVPSMPNMASYVAQLAMLHYYDADSDKYDNLTDAGKGFIDKVRKSFEKEVGEGQRKKAIEILERIVVGGDKDIIDFLTDLAVTAVADLDDGNRVYIRTYNSYALNLSVILGKTSPDSFFTALDKLYAETGTRFKFTVLEGTLNTPFIELGKAFSGLDEDLSTSTVSIDDPKFALKRSIIGDISPNIVVAPGKKIIKKKVVKTDTKKIPMNEIMKASFVFSDKYGVGTVEQLKKMMGTESAIEFVEKSLKAMISTVKKVEEGNYEGYTSDQLAQMKELVTKMEEALNSVKETNNNNIETEIDSAAVFAGEISLSTDYTITTDMRDALVNEDAVDMVAIVEKDFIKTSIVRKKIMNDFHTKLASVIGPDDYIEDVTASMEDIAYAMKEDATKARSTEGYMATIDNLIDLILKCN